MANTIEIKLLENKRAEALVNGYPYALEGSYHIIAGEVNATKFILSSVPTKYSESEFTIVGYNAGKQEAKEFKGKTFRVGSEFYLPTGMAVSGYSQLNFSTVTSDGESVKWLPIKLKIYNTMPNWADVSTNKAEELQGQIDEIKAKIEEGGTGGGSAILQKTINNSSSNVQEVKSGELSVVTVTDADVTANCHVDIYPYNVNTEQFLMTALSTNIVEVSNGSFTLSLQQHLPAEWSMYYTITEVQ